MTLEEYYEEYRQRVANMTLTQARDLIAKALSHSDMEIEFDKAVWMLLNCADEKISSGWIPVTERLPEEKINPITEDYSEYQCTVRFGNLYDVRSYKYGEGHWRLGAGIVDDFVIAWMPLPEPYEGDE